MTVHCRAGRDLPYAQGPLFDLVADVERYPEYMPGWKAAHILRRHADGVTVRQIVSLGGLRQDFITRASFARPERLRIEADSGPFRLFRLEWWFTALDAAHTHVEGEMEVRFRSAALDFASERLQPDLLKDVVAALERRAAAKLKSPPPADSQAPAADPL